MATFVGREAELDRVRSHLVAGGTAVLFGLPGVGKSQVATVYATRYRAGNQAWWVPAAGGRVAVVASLAALAARLGCVEDDAEAAAKWAVSTVAAQGDWLLVFDDVAVEADLSGLLPSGGKALVTTRNPGLARVGAQVEVTPFEPGEAAKFLCGRSGDHDVEKAKILAAEFGCLPLALEQAGAYCVEAGISLAAYLIRYQANRQQLLSSGAPPDQLAVAATLRLAVSQAGRRNPAAAQLLRLVAFLASDSPVPVELLAAGRPQLPGALSNALAHPTKWDTTVAVLRRMSLVTGDGALLRVHPLMQEVVRWQIADPGRMRRLWKAAVRRDLSRSWPLRRWLTLALRAVGDALPEDAADPAGWASWTAALPHALSVLEHGTAKRAVVIEMTSLRARLGSYLYARGEYIAAHAHIDATLTARQSMLGEEHQDTLTSMNNLALVLAELGDLPGARELHEKTLGVRKRVLGEEHQDTLTSMNNLALVLAELGDRATALKVLAQTLDARQRVLGEDHQDTLHTTYNLARWTGMEGNASTARDLLAKLVQDYERVLGAEHPDTLHARRSLANWTGVAGNKAEALKRLQDLVPVYERVLGREHPKTLHARLNLADWTAENGHVAAAKGLLADLVPAYERVFGLKHRYTLRAPEILTGRADYAADAATPHETSSAPLWTNPETPIPAPDQAMPPNIT